MSRLARELAARAEHRERECGRVLRRLSVHGITIPALARRLEVPVVGLHDLLRDLADRSFAHARDGLWFAGPDPSFSPARVVRIDPPRRPLPPSTPEEPAMKLSDDPTLSDRQRLRALVVEDVEAHPGTKAGEVAARLNHDREAVSRILTALRDEGVLRLEGTRALARWHSGDAPLSLAPHEAPAGDAADDLALLDAVLAQLGVPGGSRQFRIGFLAGLAARRVA